MEIQLLGPPAIAVGSVQRALAGRQGALLAALALSAPRPVSVDRLTEVIWGDQPPGEIVNALQQRISRLRRVVDPDRRGDLLVQTAAGYALQVDDHQIDVRSFERLAAAGRTALRDADWPTAEAAFTKALGLWRGPALGELGHEPWAVGEARRLEELRLAAAEDRIDAMLGDAAHDRALGDLVELVAAHPLRERLRGQLMVALYGAGRQADALAVYDEARRVLAEELGVDPGPQLRRIHHRILTQDGGLAAGPRPASAAPPGNLPAPRSSIVGREHALEQVDELLHHTRLLTITGPGGAGKTTLAVEAARRCSPPPGGCWLVELAPVSTGEAVVAAFADALGITGGGLGSGSIDAATLVRSLCRRHLLVVLDNCEHLLEAVGPLVEQILSAAPDVQILATSREPLALAGEVVWSVPGLGLPRKEETSADSALAAPAVQLLVERARAHSPELVLTDATAPAAVTLTRRLDGIPLAIELAAARLRVLSMTDVTAALDDRFQLLAWRARTAPSRHRTLRAALDWSWELLDAPLQRALAALSAPADGFSLAMAARLLDAVGVDAPALDVVADLVDRSLLTADTTATPTRYRMLESVRDYGRERQMELGLVDDVHTAHAEVVEDALVRSHAASSAEHFGVDIDGQAAWLDDARTALRWAHERGERARVQRIAGLLGWLWLLRGLSVEGLSWLDRGLAPLERVDPDSDDATALLWASALRAAGTHDPDGRGWAQPAGRAAATPVDRVLAHVCAAGHEINAGHVAEAIDALEAAVDDAEAVGGWPLGFVRLIAGQLAWARGAADQARRHAQDAVTLLAAAGAEWAQAHALETLIDDAIAHGHHDHARELAVEGLQLCRRHRYPELEAVMLTRLGLVVHELGEEEHAAALLDDAVARAAAVGSGSGLVEAHLGAGTAARRRGDLDAARGHLQRAQELSDAHGALDAVRVHVELAHTAAQDAQPGTAAAHARRAAVLARQIGDPRSLVRSVEALAGALDCTDQARLAVELLATAAAIREEAVAPQPPEQRDLHELLSRVRARLDTATFEQAWSAARARAGDRPQEVVAELLEAIGVPGG